jgi:hypothetical protein
MTFFLKKQNILLVDLITFFKKNIENNIIDSCHEYGLFKKNKLSVHNEDFQKIFYHHTIINFCNFIIQNEHRVVFYCSQINDNSLDLTKYISLNTFKKFTKKYFKHITKILPIYIIQTESNDNIETIKNKFLENNGDLVDIIRMTENSIDKRKKTSYSLSDAKKFAKKYELNFINKQYFEQLFVKMHLYLK